LKPFITLGQTRTPDGSNFSLHEHDGEYFLKLNGRQLMSTTAITSELLLAELPCKALGRVNGARVLIGGLGLGFSMRRALDFVRKGSTVEVAELLPEVVRWNREFLRHVNGALLDDPRVKVIEKDVFEILKAAKPGPYDAIMLDVDNGASGLTAAVNDRLYGPQGLGRCRAALKPGGRLAIWSAAADPRFVARMEESGFGVEVVKARAHPTGGSWNWIFVGSRRRG